MPRDPVTGERLENGPIRLSPHQKRIIDEALSKTPDGKFKYSTIIYSAPKKSGKSALTAAVGLYMAYHTPNAYIACVANDGKQSADRIYGPIYTCFRLHRALGGIFSKESPNLTQTILYNFSKIEAIPCDAAGEAGSEPTAILFSELWGFESEAKKRVFVEMTLPPTLEGYAIRWIETYAGYTGVSELLEQLYITGVKEGIPHPDFTDLTSDLSENNNAVVFTNEKARMFVYWDHEPRMLWQTPEYYEQEASILVPSEFKRIHRNVWSSPLGAFIQPEWWDACESSNLPLLADHDQTPVVVGIDMAVSHDCAAIVAVTRDPSNSATGIAIRAVRVFTPAMTGGTIDQEKTVGQTIKDWFERWNVLCWTYDPREMAKLAQDYARAGYGWFLPFGQNANRLISDKALYDMIQHRQIVWSRHTTEGDVGYKGDNRESLYKHVTQAGANIKQDAYRIEKLSANAHVDSAVAVSMAAWQAMKLAIDNVELDPNHAIGMLSRGQITLDQFSQMMRSANPELVERMRHGN